MKRKALSLVVLIIVLLLYFTIRPYEKATLVRVVDGDTIIVDMKGENKRIRFLLVDAPEMSNGGITSKQFVQDMIMPGQELFLEKDIGATDRYGRELRYIYLNEEDVGNIEESVNAKLVEHGMADITFFFPNYKHLPSLYYYTKLK